MLQETTWTLSCNTKQGLPRLKKLGDLSAHSRRYNLHPSDINNVASDFRVVVEELLYISHLRT
jgi:hypothetical protein